MRFSLIKCSGLHRRDCHTRWIWFLMACMGSFRPKQRTGPFKKIFWCPNEFVLKKCISRG
jgi:hypothetical protein